MLARSWWLLLFCGVHFLLCSKRLHAFTDTSGWVGAEYTPAAAPGNALWWNWFEDYEPSVDRELASARQQLGITAIRVFLHSMVYSANASRLLRNMDRFLQIAARHNISAGFVFFDDCWQHSGASLSEQCRPVKGQHNGCWMASPQDSERTSVERFRPYVTDVVARFKADSRVLWWEIFNEPNRSNRYSFALRSAGYAWAKSVVPVQPVLSCWSDNNATDIVDFHHYDTNFKSYWAKVIFSNVQKGALVTEGGSRWYQPPYSSDAGSPLTVINFLEGLRQDPSTPFVPGVMICWELMVGNSNTRWHWSTKVGAAEPAIPWDAWLFPDGTPVSYTETAALRRFISGKDEFLSFAKFLPLEVANGDEYLTLSPGEVWHAEIKGGAVADALVEVSFWPEEQGSTFSLILRTKNRTNSSASRANTSPPHADRLQQLGLDGYLVVVNGSDSALSVEQQAGDSRRRLSTFNLGGLENGLVVGAWNMLRARIVSNRLDVWFNPTYPETGFGGTFEDCRKLPQALPPRITTLLPGDAGAGGIAVAAEHLASRVDYISTLPAPPLPPVAAQGSATLFV